MFRFQIPRGKDLLTWLPVLAILAGIGVFVVLRSLNVFQRYQGLRAERIKLEEKMRSLEAERLAHEEQIRELESPQGIERLSKAKLGLKKPGEEVVIVVSEEEKPASRPGQKSFWDKIWSLIKGILNSR